MSLQVDWSEHATADEQGERRYLRVQTWFLHHRSPRCDHPRLIDLDYMDHLWLDDLRQLWQDRLHLSETLFITYVMPQPPSEDRQPSFLPHIILSQGRARDRVGVILAARFLEDHHTQLLQAAISSLDWICGSRAVALLGIRHLVQHRRWITRSGSLLIAPDELEPIRDGISISIDIRIPTEEPDEHSFITFSQGQLSRSEALEPSPPPPPSGILDCPAGNVTEAVETGPSPRPTTPFLPPWGRPIWDLISQEGIFDPGEEDYLIYPASYFIDHHHHRRHDEA